MKEVVAYYPDGIIEKQIKVQIFHNAALSGRGGKPTIVKFVAHCK
jgi:hypothetical protein